MVTLHFLPVIQCPFCSLFTAMFSTFLLFAVVDFAILPFWHFKMAPKHSVVVLSCVPKCMRL